jgi:hypothetical protein
MKTPAEEGIEAARFDAEVGELIERVAKLRERFGLDLRKSKALERAESWLKDLLDFPLTDEEEKEWDAYLSDTAEANCSDPDYVSMMEEACSTSADKRDSIKEMNYSEEEPE